MSTIANLGNGIGYLYITQADGLTFVNQGILNTTSGKLSILSSGVIGAPVSGQINGTGTLTLTGAPDDLTALTVNAVPIISATVPAAATLADMANDIRDAINTYVTTPDYYAQSSGDTVYIFTTAGVGASANGFAVAAACDPLMTVTTTPISGGTDATGIYDASTGYRYFINANSTAVYGSLAGATEITKYILTRGTQTSQYSTTATISAGVIGPERILKEMDLIVDTQGGAGADDLDTILTAGYNDFDEIIIRGANPAHVVTVKNATGNIYLANNLDWSSGNNQNVLALKKIGNSWYEEFRSPNLELTVANMRASGLAIPVQGVDLVTMPTNGTVNIEPGVDKGYYVVSGSPVLIGSVVYQIEPSPATPYLDGDSVTLDYIATATPGVNNVTIFGITLTPTQANSGNVVVTTTYDLSSTTWYSTIVTKSDGRDFVDSTQLATKEDSLGNPAIDGALLSSTAAGVRSWIANQGQITLKNTLPYTAWQPNATATGSAVAFTLPAGSVPLMIKIKHSQEFSGGAITTATADIVVDGTIYSSGGLDVFAAPSNQSGMILPLVGPIAPNFVIPNQVLDCPLSILMTVDTVIDDLTQGSLDVWVSYITAV